MSDEIKGYNPKSFEENYYKIWEERGCFEVDGNRTIQESGKNFCIMIPPPNVTGSLHIGHALNNTLQDIIVRYKRMDGYKTLWQPGTDHAGIATQNVVEKRLLKDGIKKEELGREKFLEKVWEWKAFSGGTIVNQLRKLGVSPAWKRERFTMDDGLQNSVKEAFVKLYEDGFIVRGNYMVNWCTHDGALSDIEVDYDEKNGHLYHIRYPLSDGSGHIVVATTRPETYFGDTAVMVNPNDERYTHLIGKSVKLPLINREIPIIADDHVDMEFGTGCVKVTPAHDPNDYEVGKRHNLEFLTIFDENGILNSECGEFSGFERLEARAEIVEKLRSLGYVEKVDEHKHQVGHCYRCGNVVEPYISKQWFVKKELATKAIERANSGEVSFFPKEWINNYNAWMKDLRDWCISRQLWWGHRIPVFYCRDCGAEFASREAHPQNCTKCSSTNIYQDPDVLDTWFSSGLWPFSTLGWGNGEGEKERWSESDLRDFYPNALLITAFDILFFWVARMLMMGEHLIGNLPFRDIYLHALVRDEHGQKMSKSKGNVIDPLELIEKYGADATRFTLAYLAVQGRDIRLSAQQLDISKNFCNKLCNASKYLLMNAQNFKELKDIDVQTPLGKYMLSRFNACVNEVRDNIDSYRFNDSASALYRFLWGEFCDWGIELSKASKESIHELGSIFKEAMKLLHPIMPFLSESLYHELSGTTMESGTSIMVMSYPKSAKQDEEIEATFALIIEAIVSVRRAKATIDLANKKIDFAYIKLNKSAPKALFETFVPNLARVEKIEFVDEKQKDCITDVSDNLEVFIPTGSIDLSPIIARLESQKTKLEKEVMKLDGMLNNENFVKNAPPQVLEQNRSGLSDAKEKLEKIEAELKSLKG